MMQINMNKKRYWEIIESMEDNNLNLFVKKFIGKRFGISALNDLEYLSEWIKRFREKNYLLYMDKISKTIFFELIDLENLNSTWEIKGVEGCC